MPGIIDNLFGSGRPGNSAADLEREYRKGLLAGYARGFIAARDKIAAMLEEEGRDQTAQRVRRMELKRKESR